MSYLDRNLLADERVLFRTRKHIIIFFWPMIWTVFSIYASFYMYHNPILIKVIPLPWIAAGVLWLSVGLNYLTSEFAVTNKRVMMREGFFVRHSNEIRLNAISQVNVDQSLFAQILNYGVVSINAFGAFDSFALISKPCVFQQMVNQQLDNAVRG